MTAPVSIYADDELVEAFDDKVWELKQDGKLERDVSRSEVMRRLMEEWVRGNSNSRRNVPIATAD